jgi:Ca2+-binding EF-hand superfamily protein
VNRFQAQTNFGSVPARELEKVFRRFASSRGVLAPAQFERALRALEEYGLRPVAGSPLAVQLFRVFDRDKSGSVDLDEFLRGAALLCGGTLDDKAEITFRAFDRDGSGFLEEGEIVQMITESYDAAVKMALSIDTLGAMDDLTASVVDTVRKQMEVLAVELMHKIDANGDGRLSLDEFKIFCSMVEDVKATVNGFKGTVNITV